GLLCRGDQDGLILQSGCLFPLLFLDRQGALFYSRVAGNDGKQMAVDPGEDGQDEADGPDGPPVKQRRVAVDLHLVALGCVRGGRRWLRGCRHGTLVSLGILWFYEAHRGASPGGTA